MDEAIKPLADKVAQLEGNVQQIGDQPGATKTLPAPVHDPDAKGDPAKAAWLAQNAEADKAFADSVKKGEALKIQS